MPLSMGSRLGPYEILAPLGAGGMGEVYRARDTKLGRDVALKIVPEEFARDADRMVRFQREAKFLASLNHPNIASIYGLEDSGSTRALVMELVEGPTLADRIRSGPTPMNEALPIARQICDALEYAHERGIVHRDLKPANVNVTSDDTVKILDFGLAKAIKGDGASPDIVNSPTLSQMATQSGILLGTAAYMSPEQAKGKTVDRRTDIWAFGCVLYEMLTGKMAFRGESVTDTLAAILKNEPDWTQLPMATPTRVRVLLQRCLQKDSKQRLRDIGDARISLDEVLSAAPEPAGAGTPQEAIPRWRHALPWAVAAAFAIALAALAWVYLRLANAPARAAEPVRFQVPLPEKTSLANFGLFALSPDGRQLAFSAAGSDGIPRLWVRALDSLEARPVSGSESAGDGLFFWSPDSQFIALAAGGKLKKIAISGGPAETICDISGIVVGGSWNRDGVIIFGRVPGGLMRVSAMGGSPSPLTTLDSSRGDVTHVFPSFLPDGRHFIYLRRSTMAAKTGVYIGSLDSKAEKQDLTRLVATPFGPAYAPSADGGSGQLLFVRDGALMAQPFDARRLELSGEPVTVAEQVGVYIGAGYFSVSANNVLIYRTGGPPDYQLRWFDSQGKVVGTAGEPRAYISLALSPDGTRAAVSSAEAPARTLWVLDLSRSTSTRFTFGVSGNQDAVWSPDGNRIVFGSNRDGPFNLYEKPASGAKDEEPLLKSSEDKYPSSWSPDGRFLLYFAFDPNTKQDLWVLPLQGDRKPFPFLKTEFNETDGHFSPDGHWIAYSSDESGHEDIYVRPFSLQPATATQDTGAKWQVSTGGGKEPRWSENGKELYYLAPDAKLMVVEVTTSSAFQVGVPKALFQAPPSPAPSTPVSSSTWDLSGDGKRYLFIAPAERSTAAPFTVVLNWQSALKK
jgi:eukaryotic-like serine/threonine-protein kinase